MSHLAWTTLLGACCCGLGGVAVGGTITVDDDLVDFPKAQFTSIAAAIGVAQAGDTVLVYPGTYTDAGASVVDPLGKAIVIRSVDGPSTTILSGEGARRVVKCGSGESSATTIEGFTITGGSADAGAGVRCDQSSPTIRNCIIHDCHATSAGGGAYLQSSGASFEACDFISCSSALNAGGMFIGLGDVTLTDCLFEDNWTIYAGGALRVYGDATRLDRCIFRGNKANSNGGGASCEVDSAAQFVDCLFADNHAEEFGVDLYCAEALPTIEGTRFCGAGLPHLTGHWVDAGGNCFASNCDDADQNGNPDQCDSTLAVTRHVPGEYPTIQAAIDAASNGDTVLVAPGVYTGQGDWVANPGGKRITVRGSGLPSETVLDGGNARLVVECASGEGAETVFQGLTITHGRYRWGGGISCFYTSPTFIDCIISDNVCTEFGGGGAAFHWSGTPTITGCTFSGNASPSGAGGGVLFYRVSGVVRDCVLTGNSAEIDGGVRVDNADLLMEDCTLSYNIAEGDAGGVTHYGGLLTMRRCVLTGNQTTGGGRGGILAWNCEAVIEDCEFTQNVGKYAGGVQATPDSTAAITRCTFTDNRADYGGGISSSWSSMSVTLTDSLVCGNAPDQIYGPWIDGGGTCVASLCDDADGNGQPDQCGNIVGGATRRVPQDYPTIQEAIIAAVDNDIILVAPGTYTGAGTVIANTLSKSLTIRADGPPGSVVLDGEDVRTALRFSGGNGAYPVLEGVTITRGRSTWGGGGIYCEANAHVTMVDCTVTQCYAAVGAGLYAATGSSLSAIRCAFEENVGQILQGAQSYGGGICAYGGVTLTDCSIINNSAASRGGGLYLSGATVSLSGCSIVANESVWGGGLYLFDSNGSLHACAVTDNIATNEAGGLYTAGGSLSISSCTVTRNTGFYGGGIYAIDTNPLLTGTTVCGNDMNQLYGQWTNQDSCVIYNCAVCQCVGDVDGDGVVKAADVAACLAGWGACGGCPADVDDSGTVDGADVAAVLVNWGECP